MSLHLVKIGRDQAIVCSDSIALAQNGARRTDQEKLFKTGEYSVCGIVGQCELGPGYEIRSRIDALLRTKRLRDSPDFLARLSDEVYKALSTLLATIPSLFQWLLTDTSLLFGAFWLKREHTGEVTFQELRIPLENVGGKPAIGRPEIIDHLDNELLRGTFIFRLGCDCLEDNRLTAIEPDLADDAAILASVDGMVDGFKQDYSMCAREIGGMVEVVGINAAGVRWLRKDRAKASRIGRARRQFSSLFSCMVWAANLACAAR